MLTVHLPHTIETILVQHQFYGFDVQAGYQVMLSLSVVLLGLAFSGILIAVTTFPSHFVFPQVLPPAALMTALHRTQQGVWNRSKVFYYAWISLFCWTFFPHYVFTGLQAFSWLAWTVPTNKTVNIIFGGTNGLGLNFLTFDWNTVNRAWGSPLYVPFYCQVNLFAGYLLFICFLAPILWTANVSRSSYLPYKSETQVFDRWGSSYRFEVAAGGSGVVYNPRTFDSYSKPYITITQAMATAGLFAAVPASIVHCILYHRNDLRRIWHKCSRHKDETSRLDIHAYLMQRYPIIPWYWFLILGLVGLALAIPTVNAYHTSVPIWLLAVTLVSAAILLLPVGIMSAITSVQIDMHMLFFEIAGFGSRGHPSTPLVTNMYGNGVITVALGCATAVKFGHYFKVQQCWILVGQLVGCMV